MSNGSFVVSLDFELYWGLIDWRSLDSYAGNLRGVRYAAAGATASPQTIAARVERS